MKHPILQFLPAGSWHHALCPAFSKVNNRLIWGSDYPGRLLFLLMVLQLFVAFSRTSNFHRVGLL